MFCKRVRQEKRHQGQIKCEQVLQTDLERRNGCYFAYSADFGINYVKMVEDRPVMSATKIHSLIASRIGAFHYDGNR